MALTAHDRGYTAVLAGAMGQSNVARAATAVPVSAWVDQMRRRYEQLAPPHVLPMNTVVSGVCHSHFPMRRVCRQLAYMGPKYNRNRFAAMVLRMTKHDATVMVFSRGSIVCTGVSNYQIAKYCTLDVKQRLDAAGYRLIADEFDAIGVPIGAPGVPRHPYLLYDERAASASARAAADAYRRAAAGRRERGRVVIDVPPTHAPLREFFASAFREMHRANVVGSTMMAYPEDGMPMTIDLDLLQFLCREIVIYQPGAFPGACFAPPALSPVRVLVFRSGRMVVTGGRAHTDLEHAMRHTHAVIRVCSTRSAKQFYAYYEAHNPAVLDEMAAYLELIREDAAMKREARKMEKAVDMQLGTADADADAPDAPELAPSLDAICKSMENMGMGRVDGEAGAVVYATFDDEDVHLDDESPPLRKRVRNSGE